MAGATVAGATVASGADVAGSAVATGGAAVSTAGVVVVVVVVEATGTADAPLSTPPLHAAKPNTASQTRGTRRVIAQVKHVRFGRVQGASRRGCLVGCRWPAETAH